MPAIEVDIGSMITRTPGVHGGDPCIAGTGVSVMRIANYYNMGYTPEEIAENYGHITPAQVYVAIAYYYANKEAIDADIAEENVLYEKYSKENSNTPADENK
jgi:uncharacterized protein (DUF433 family)